VCRELVLVDRARERAKSVGQIYSAALLPMLMFVGDFNDLEGAALIMIRAGINARTGGMPRVG
jgi:TRAP-type mannitol/chloroaromatic compound transport system permease large subunit